MTIHSPKKILSWIVANAILYWLAWAGINIHPGFGRALTFTLGTFSVLYCISLTVFVLANSLRVDYEIRKITRSVPIWVEITSTIILASYLVWFDQQWTAVLLLVLVFAQEICTFISDPANRK